MLAPVNLIGMLLLLVVAVAWLAVRLFDIGGDRVDDVSEGLATLVRLFAWILVAIGLLLAFGPVAALVVLVCIATTLAHSRSAQKDSLLWILSVTANQQIPLTEGLEDFAYECSGPFRRKVRALTHSLAAGTRLSDALPRIRGLLSTQGLVAVRVGEACGDLPTALTEAARTASARGEALRDVRSKVLYLLAVVLVEMWVVSFVFLKIVPALQKILWDFEVGEPWVTSLMFDISGSRLWPITFSVLSLLGAASVVLLILNITLGGSASIGPSWTSQARLDNGTILRNLALVIDQGKTLLLGLSAMSASFPSTFTRRRLLRALYLLHQGTPWTNALRSARIIRSPDSAVLEAAERAGNLSWALREVAASSDRRIGYRLRAWSEVLFPLAVLGLGLVVLIVAVGCLWPMFLLIESLA